MDTILAQYDTVVIVKGGEAQDVEKAVCQAGDAGAPGLEVKNKDLAKYEDVKKSLKSVHNRRVLLVQKVLTGAVLVLLIAFIVVLAANPRTKLTTLSGNTTSVTICNNNIIMSTKSTELMESVLRYIYGDLQVLDQEELPYLDSNGWLWFYIMGQHQMESMLLKCEVDGDLCNSTHFTPTLTETGLCHIFNPSLELQQTANLLGLSNLERTEQSSESPIHQKQWTSLKVWLNTQQEVYSYQPFSQSAGFTVMVQSSSRSDKTPYTEVEPQLVATGEETKLDVRLSESTLSSRCMDQCMTRRGRDECSCTLFFDAKPSTDKEICNPFDTRACMNKDTSKFQDACLEECQRENFLSPAIERASGPVSMNVITQMSDLLPHSATVSHYNSSGDSFLELPENPYYYWKENLAILDIRQRHGFTSRTTDRMREITLCVLFLTVFCLTMLTLKLPLVCTLAALLCRSAKSAIYEIWYTNDD